MSDEPYELVGPDTDAALAGLPGQRVIAPDADQLADQLATDMAWMAHERVRAVGEFHLALSGGSSPQALYRQLIIDPRYRLFPWRRTHMWIVDERCVDPDDERSNVRMIREFITEHSDIPADHFHPMPATEADGDRRYEDTLRDALGRVDNRLDYVLLGMGADAHTASLFPATEALQEQTRWVVVNDGETVAPPRPRMTLTFPLINAARRIAILVTGGAKHETLKRVEAAAASGATEVMRLPVTGIRPTPDRTDLIWYLDYASALGATDR